MLISQILIFKKGGGMKNITKFLVITAVMLLAQVFNVYTKNDIKQDIAKEAKKAVKNAAELKQMKTLAVISVWGVDWHARGMAGPGDIGYSDNRNMRKNWMAEIFEGFEPRLETALNEMFKAVNQEVKPLGFAIGNENYQQFTPQKTEPKLGLGYLQNTIEGFKFIDDEPSDVTEASKTMNVDGVITMRYKLEPSLLPMMKNKLKIWMKIFNNSGELVWHGEIYSEFAGNNTKFLKLKNYADFMPAAEKNTLNNLKLVYVKSLSKLK